MHRSTPGIAWALTMASLGCGGDRDGGRGSIDALDAPPTAPPSVDVARPDVPAPTATSVAATALPTATAPSAPPQPEISEAFLPHDATCKVDSDCAATRFGVGRFACCGPCGAAAGTKAWAKRADAKCEAIQKSGKYGPCPPEDCGSISAKCSAGQCVPAIP